MITEVEHLLICLNEECVEVAQRCDKALRFGLDDTDPTIPGAPTERTRIAQEFYDLLAIVEMLEERGVLNRTGDTHAIERKKAKVLHFMEYARQRGTLE